MMQAQVLENSVMQRSKGFTVIELMIVLAIAAILASLAAPSVTRFLRVSEMSNAVNTWMSDLRWARSEAVRRGGHVVMCRSENPEAASPACTTSLLGPSGKGWVTGWFIFHDLDADGNKDAAEPVLRVQSALPSINVIVESSSSTKFRYTASGRLMNSGLSTTVTFGASPEYSNDLQRVLCVNVGGRARIAGDGLASCS
jgi:type IV fimbrial biogenesis protein FimT